MDINERLNSLLLLWQEEQLRGRDLSPAELCRDCPELAAELAERIRILRHMNGVARPTDEIMEAVPTSQAETSGLATAGVAVNNATHSDAPEAIAAAGAMTVR